MNAAFACINAPLAYSAAEVTALGTKAVFCVVPSANWIKLGKVVLPVVSNRVI
jgi:hypothetical protein